MNISTQNLDLDLYDRQIRTYGLKETEQIANSSIMIIGLQGGLATEICKNLALGNTKTIYLYDLEKVINYKDLETGYYYKEEDIGFLRSEILKKKINELNPHIILHSCNSYKENQNVTIVINQNVEYILEINKYCRHNNSKLIVLFSGGLSGVIFVDAGDYHKIDDITGEIHEAVQLASISSTGICTCVQNSKHNFQINDIIKLDNLEVKVKNDSNEFSKLNLLQKEWEIESIDKSTFKLKNFSFLNCEIINGTAHYITKPIYIKHESFEKQIKNPNINPNFDMIYSHELISTYLQLFRNNLIDGMPIIWSIENDNFMKDHNICLKDQARIFNLELCPVVSLMGAIVAAETIKLLTNKYMPINQWFTWTDTNLIPHMKPADYTTNSVYSILYGYEYEKILLESNILLVGSGAIGCEHLKNLACMNIGTSEHSKIIVTDPDTIEKSNLSRQLLFRSIDVGKLKTEVAAKSIKTLKPNIKITALSEKVGYDNLEFTDRLLNENNITCVFNALDNIQARKFIDEQCFKYNIPLLESGTHGMKGNTQPIIPFITETYSASTDPEQEKTYPVCTIKSFPNEIFHTIHWAIDNFEFFNRAPQIINKLIDNNNYLETLSDHEKLIALEDIDQLFITYPFNVRKDKEYNICLALKYAIDIFIKNYYIMIIKLLDIYKPNHEISPGVLFWSAGKRCPIPIKYDINNELHINFTFTTAYLILQILNINCEFDIQSMKAFIQKYSDDIKYDILISQTPNKKSNEINYDILNKYQINKINYNSIKFNKDNNLHINWISCAANLRASNYNIPLEDEYVIKGIAGRIIPAVITTTAAVSGLILIEFLKYIFQIINRSEYNIYRSNFINLAEPIIIYSQPIEAPLIDIAGVKINSWQKFEYKNNTTLKKFKLYYENMFQISINMIVHDTTIIYADDFMEDNLDNYLDNIINNLNINQSNTKIIFILIAIDEIKELPNINIIL